MAIAKAQKGAAAKARDGGPSAWDYCMTTDKIIKYLHLDVYDSSEYKIKLHKRAAIWNIVDCVWCMRLHMHFYINV